MVTRHIYLSPHLDDAIFSCGGLIHWQRAAGESVEVINLCAGVPDYTQISPFAQCYHNAWGNPPDVVGTRRAEDQAVLEGWSIVGHYLDTPDSIYRCVGSKVAYPDVAALFADPHATEADHLVASWQQQVLGIVGVAEKPTLPKGDVEFFAPLAAGNHVDHQLGRALGLRLAKLGWMVWFYEDFPHAEGPGLIQAVLNWFGPVMLRHRAVPVDVDVKISAMRGYKSQIPFIFGNEHGLTLRVKRFTAERACDINWFECARAMLAGSGGRRERLWRTVWGYHAHAECFWRVN